MKTRIIKVTFVAVIAMVSAINAFNANKVEAMSDTVLANVEALANGESQERGNYDIWEDITYRYFNGEVYQQSKITTCHEGGQYACKEGKYYRYQQSDGSWSEWVPA